MDNRCAVPTTSLAIAQAPFASLRGSDIALADCARIIRVHSWLD
jgi:hypothetical protein